MLSRYIVSCLVHFALIVTANIARASDSLPRIPPTEPADAAATVRLQDGFRLELLAAEPLVTDPVAMVYDENGRAYVVEMNDYPFTDPSLDKAWADQESPAIGRVRLLEDEDGDGVFDRSTVFAEELSWPTGIACWKGGVFVTATPDIWYLKDTDGDRVADVRELVFTGFRKFNVQAVINNLQWGLDHKLYAAGSSNGGSIQRSGADGQPIALGRQDFRFDPETGEFEVLSGGARFGNSFDDWGNRFICNLRNPVQHIVFDDHYLKLNPSVRAATTIHNASDAGDAVPVFRVSPPEPWRVVNAARLAAQNRAGTPRSEMNAVGFVTSASGVTVYRGSAYPAEYAGNAFVGEVAGNLLIRYRLEPDGATFRATRADHDEEFLASTDNWFRPVNLVNAPDGTLHLLDMYRETIEHPWSIPDDIKAQLDLTSGRDRGRIYRIVPPKYRKGFTPPPQPQLGSATTAELVATLENPNSWWRETAQRLLYERQDASAVPLLRELTVQPESAVARLHALYALDGLAGLSEFEIRASLADQSPRVQEHAIRFAEPRLPMMAQEVATAVRAQISALASDHDPRVRMQAILTRSRLNPDSDRADSRWMLRHDTQDAWLRLAARIALTPKDSGQTLKSVLENKEWIEESGATELASELLEQAMSGVTPPQLGEIVRAITDSPSPIELDLEDLRFMLLLQLSERLPASQPFSSVVKDLELDEQSQEQISRLTSSSLALAAISVSPVERRVLAIKWLASIRSDRATELLADLIDIQQPQGVQRAAAAGLARSADPRVADMLLERYSKLTPALREQVISVLLSRTDRLQKLFDAIEAGTVPAADVPPARRSAYLRSSSDQLRTRAEKLFGSEATPSEKRALIARYRKALAAPADPQRGRTVFTRECANCHRLDGAGHDVGPALVTVRARTPAEILEHILDPNREVSPHYLEYVVLQYDGAVKTGAIASETPTSITLRQPLGKQETVSRSEIETVTSSGKSLMPDGLEKKVTPDEMRDLIEFVRSATK